MLSHPWGLKGETNNAIDYFDKKSVFSHADIDCVACGLCNRSTIN